MITVKLPLPASQNRCLAHGDRPGEFCTRRTQCARHESIHHDAIAGQSIPAYYTACADRAFNNFIPVGGYPVAEEVAA